MSDVSVTNKTSLKFSEKYNQSHAEHYLAKHQASPASKLSHWRDVQVARKALQMAGNPDVVLDLPCGAGRFWPMLAEQKNRMIIGADNSENMIAVATQAQPTDVVGRVRPLRTSAFDIDLPDDAVDSVFCMRLMHHIGDPAHRMQMLREFHRVARSTVIVSLWVDGNYKAWRRQKLETRRIQRGKATGYRNRFVLPAKQIESEFLQAGFSIVDSLDFMPFYAMWRFYILRKP